MSEPPFPNDTALESKRVVIVGNGPSLLGSGHGDRIDGFDEIIRFNRFVTGQHHHDVGSRTTIWFTNRTLDHASTRAKMAAHDFREIHVHTWHGTAEAAQSYRQALLEMKLTAIVHKVDKCHLREMRDYLGEDYRMFSTGAIGVWLMLHRFAEVSVVGFDWWTRPPRLHYFNHQEFPYDSTRGHQPEIEKRFFEKLVRDRRVVFMESTEDTSRLSPGCELNQSGDR